MDDYDEDGKKTVSNNRYGNSKGFNGSKRSVFSKNQKNSKRSSLSKSWLLIFFSLIIVHYNGIYIKR